MSNSVRPHRRQPTRLCHPWDSPGKNTGVGCHFLLQCRKVKSESEVAQSCWTLRDPMDCSLPGSSVHGIFQARVLEWGAIAFSITDSSVLKSYITDYFIFLCSCIFLIYVPLRTCVHASVHAKLLSHVQLCSLTDYSSTGPSVHGISRQEYWSELP